MEPLKTTDLTVKFSEALKKSGHAEVTRVLYGRVAKRLADYAAKLGQEDYSADLARQFLADIYPVGTELHSFQWTHLQATARRAVRLMDDLAEKGVISLRKQSPTDGLDERSLEMIEQYSRWLADKGRAESTVKTQLSNACGFLRFLIQLRREHKDITDKDVVLYLNYRDNYSTTGLSHMLYSLKQFAQFLYDQGVISTNIVPLLPQGRQNKLANIVSVWKPGHVEKILGAVDRGSPIGRRDYAIILLTTRLGLRQTDILGLRLDSVDWDNNRIEITQSKTGEPISLPLPEDAGWAIIDYLKNGRPKVDSPYVFVCHSKKAWGDRLSSFHTTLTNYIRESRVQVDDRQKHGMHSLRHTLATRLIEAKVPLHIISEILGQISPDSVEKYLKVDVEMLRECALNPQEVFKDAKPA